MNKGDKVRLKHVQGHRNNYNVCAIYTNVDDPNDSFVNISYAGNDNTPRSTLICKDALEVVPQDGQGH